MTAGIRKSLFAVFPFIAMCGAHAACEFDRTKADAAVKSQNYSEAARIFGDAANCGNAEANYDLGVLLARGMGVTKDEALAVKHYLVAARAGYTEAQNNLGLMYTLGRGVGKDRVQGDAWFLIAARNGHEGARFNSNSAQKEMSAEEIQRASDLANNWVPPI